MEVADAVERYKLLNSFVGQVLREGTDYGKIPGAGDKATLLKPGAEKLSMFFGLSPTFEHVRASRTGRARITAASRSSTTSSSAA